MAQVHLAEIAFAAGERIKGTGLLQQALSLDPNYPAALTLAAKFAAFIPREKIHLVLDASLWSPGGGVSELKSDGSTG